MPQPPAHPDPLSSLLADGAWLRRLAVGLVGESGAEDLAQDVMVSAIKLPPQGNDAQLRSWAKTVARRLALRNRERNRGRQHAEQRASKSEISDQESEQRLLLYRRLTEAILALETTHRTVLVMRYMEDLAPQEIAQRLDIAPATARKRLSRALVKLREVLDGEFGDRSNWTHALGPMAFGAGWQDMLPALKTTTALAPVSVGVLTPILALLTMKKLLATSIVLCAALLVGVPALQDWLRAPEGGPSADALVQEQAVDEPLEVDLVAKDVAESRDSVAPIAQVPAGSSTPQIHLIDSLGKTVAGGVGAWVDTDRRVHALDFDEAGRADLPEAALGSMCLVGAPELSIEDFLIGAVDQDMVVELGEMTTLAGRLLVDGIPPPKPLDLVCTWFQKSKTRIHHEDYSGMELDQIAVLHKLGLIGGESLTRTLPGGGFVFEGVQPMGMGHVELPSYLKVLPSGKWSRATFQSTERDMQIESQSLPYVHGHMVWADDGTPYTEMSSVGFTNRLKQEIEFTLLYPTDTGEFFVPLRFISSDRAQGLEHVSIRLQVAGSVIGGGQDFDFPVDAATSVIEAGILRVNRKELTQVRVIDELDEPVSDVLVASSVARARTDTDGRVALSIPPRDVVFALANGHGLGVLDLSSASVEAGGSYVICLPKGNDLTISCDLRGVEVVGEAITPVHLELPNELLGARSHKGRSLLNFYQGALERTHGEWLYDWGVRKGFVGNSDPIVLPGLAAGTLIRATMLDAKGNTLALEEIRIPHERVPSNLDLVPNPSTCGSIIFEVVNDRGVPLQMPRVEGLSGDWLMGHFSGQEGKVVVTPLAIGPYRFLVDASDSVPAYVDVELGAGVQRERVVLSPGRDVALRFEDETGVVFNPESVTLLNDAGEPVGEPLKPKGGKLRLAHISKESKQVLVLSGTEFSRHTVPADEQNATIVLPTPGTLRVHFEQLPRISAHQGNLSLLVKETAGDRGRALERKDTFNRGADSAWDLQAALHPGTYLVQVLVNTDTGAVDKEATTRTLFSGQVTVLKGEEALITISAGKNPTATLTPR